MQQILGDIDEHEPLPDLYWSKIRRALKPFIYFAGAIRDIRFIHGAFYEVTWCQNDYNVFKGLDCWLIFESLFFKLRFYISFGYVFLCIPSEQSLVPSKLNLYNSYQLLSVIKKTPSQTSLKKYWLYWFLLYRMPRCYILKRTRLRLCTIPLLSII